MANTTLASELETAGLNDLDRRSFMAYLSVLGIGGTGLWQRAQQEGSVTKDMIAQAEGVFGLEFTDEERELMVRNLNRNITSYEALRTHDIPNSVPPAIVFDPVLPSMKLPTEEREFRYTRPTGVSRPANLEELAFEPVTVLSELVRTKQVTSTQLTRMYLDRLKRHGPTLECVITLTAERAQRQARQADAEIALGNYRGPLLGSPWGASDLQPVRDPATR